MCNSAKSRILPGGRNSYCDDFARSQVHGTRVRKRTAANAQCWYYGSPRNSNTNSHESYEQLASATRVHVCTRIHVYPGTRVGTPNVPGHSLQRGSFYPRTRVPPPGIGTRGTRVRGYPGTGGGNPLYYYYRHY
eukprot:1531848-Rhodomonas_salina.1